MFLSWLSSLPDDFVEAGSLLRVSTVRASGSGHWVRSREDGGVEARGACGAS